jgi:hypothetical protein
MSARLALPALGALATLVLAACDRSPVQPLLDHADALSPAAAAHAHHGAGLVPDAAAAARDLATMRQATARYQRFEEALADGFVPLSECVAAPWGGMGYHYGRPDRIGDTDIDPAAPEILLYEPTEDGRMRLVGVEFMVHGEGWYAAGNEAAPSVGGVSLDPPNPAHPDAHLRPFYTLHAWVWRDNPDGMFAPFNPNVRCG